MALTDYTIKFSSNDDENIPSSFYKPPIVVGEKTTNTAQTPLTLFGKYSIDFGEGLQTNLVRMLENFSRDKPPENPTVGQLWFDTISNELQVLTSSPAGGFWKPVGGSVFDIPVASESSPGLVAVASPFTVDSSGKLSLPDLTYATVTKDSVPESEYSFQANANFSKGVYSADDNNFIAPTASSPAPTFNKYFITKKYADDHYAASGSIGGLTTLPPATSTAVGGVIVGEPFKYTPEGKISLKNMTFDESANEYGIAADVTVENELVSGDPDNHIFSDAEKSPSDYDNHFITKHFADENYDVLKNLPAASSSTKGGVKVGGPFAVAADGTLSLQGVAYDEDSNEYTVDAGTKSVDDNNTIGSDNTAPDGYYDKFFVTKKYADGHYAANDGTGTGGGTVPVASSTTVGGVKVAKPFDVSQTGTLSLKDVVYTEAVEATETDPAIPSEYEVSAAIKSSVWLYSDDITNTIGLDPEKNYDGYFITKKYADDHYYSSEFGGGGSTSPYVLPAASAFTLGGIKLGKPFEISATGVLSLPQLAYDSNKKLYDFAASVKTSADLYSSDNNNNIYKDATKPVQYYDTYYVTKYFADQHYVLVEDSYVLPTSSDTVLGGIKVGVPFEISETGVLTLPYITFDSDITEYTAGAFLKMQKDAYSTDTYNFIGSDIDKQLSEYDNYFVTKKYVEEHFTGIEEGINNIATSNSLGSIKVGQPLSINALTGVLSLPNITHDLVQNEYSFAAKIRAALESYSVDIDNYIFKNPNTSASVYDYYFTTKHYTDTNYIQTGAAFSKTKTSKSQYFIEYATGFELTDFNGYDNALVTKQYVDGITIGPTTNLNMSDKSVLFANGGKFSESSNLTFDTSTGTLKTLNGVFVNDPVDEKTSVVSVYSPNADSTIGASVGLFASEAPVIYPAGQTPPSVPPAVNSGTLLGNIMFGGWDSEESYRSATISAYCTEMWSSTNHGSKILFSVTSNGSVDPSVALTINNDKSIQIAQCVIETIAAPTGTNITLNPNSGSLQKITTSGDTIISMPSIISMTGKSITLVIKYTGTHSITWSGGTINWSEDQVPVTSSVANLTDIFSFFGDGDKIYGVVSGQAYT
jgi:hypothetical protein